jgi:hypothetical protein
MSQLLLLASVAIGFFLGIFSVFFFLGVWVGGGSSTVGVLLSLGLAALAAVHATRLGLRSLAQPSVPRFSFRTAVFAIAFVSALATLLVALLSLPHGWWDAWGIWNMHARFLYRGGPDWTDVFLLPMYSDYPFLLPSIVAGGWALLHNEHTVVPMFVAFLFTALTIALMIGSVSVRRNDWLGLAAGAALVAAPEFLRHGAYQMADVPLGFYFLLAFSLLQLSEISSHRAILVAGAGLSAGLAAWTKNEGMLFAAVLTLAWTGSVLLRDGVRAAAKNARWLVAGMAPVLLVLAAFKILLAPPNDMTSAGDSMWMRLSDSSRFLVIARGYAGSLLAFGNGVVHPVVPVAALVVLAAGRGGRWQLSSAQLCTLLTIVGTALGYAIVYLATPHDLVWHIYTSLDRLLMQLWPGLVFAVACIGAPLRRDTGILQPDATRGARRLS